MFYLVDFDSRSVVTKTTTRSKLEAYITDNTLSLAVVIIANEDELLVELSLVEMQALYDGISDHNRPFQDEDEAAAITWSTIESVAANIPKFTNALGKRLIKAAGGDPTPQRAVSALGPKPGSKFEGAVFVAGAVDPVAGVHTEIINLVEDYLGEVTYAELCNFLSNQNGDVDVNINFAIDNGFLCIEENA